MSFKKRHKDTDKTRATAAARLALLNTGEILEWADQLSSGIGKTLSDYRRLNDPDSLEEARFGASQLQGALDVLTDRGSSSAHR